MSFKKNLITILAALSIGVTGCGKKSNELELIEGIPKSVAYEQGSYISIVLENKEGKKREYSSYAESIQNSLKAASLIQAEIEDGDNEKILMYFKGKVEKERLSKIKVEDNYINF